MTRWARAVAALVALAALVIGLPVLLVLVAGWPLPSKPPDWSHVGRMLEQGDVPAVAVLNTLATGVWVLWLAILWSLCWELTTTFKAAAPHPRVAARHTAPAVPAVLSSGIGRLVAAVFAVGITITPPDTASASALPNAAVTVDHHAPSVSTPPANPAQLVAASAIGPVRWVAGPADTPWSIAEAALGDPARVDEIIALNPTVNPARPLQAGHQIALPPDAHVPTEHRPRGATVCSDTSNKPATTATVVVQPGDTLWDLAATHLATNGHHPTDGTTASYIAQVHAANEDTVADPDLIYPGQQLILPAVTAPAGQPSARSSAEPTSYLVVEGDTLWDVLAAHYGPASVTAELVWDVAAANHLEDPDTIYPGQHLHLPATERPSHPPTAAQANAETGSAAAGGDTGALADASVPAATASTTQARPPSRSTPTTATEPAASAPALQDTSPPAADRSGPRIDQPSGRNTGEPDTAADARDAELSLFDTATRTVWWSAPGGVLLAAGIGLHVRRLRGRRLAELPIGDTTPSPTPVAAGTELAVTTRARDTATTLNRLLRSLTPHLRALHDPPPIRAVEVSDDRVEILFAHPAPDPPAGWTSPDGGRSWVHRHDHHQTLPATSRQLLAPALVTIGHRTGGGDVLLDVETAGSIALTGDHDACAALARSMILELATYPLGVPIDVAPIGVELDGIEHCDRVWPDMTLTRAVRVVNQLRERTTETGATSILRARAALDDDQGTLDPHVFVIDRTSFTDTDEHLLDDLVGRCQPQAGPAVVVIGGHPNAHEQLELDNIGQLRWHGSVLQAPAVAHQAASQLAATFEEAATAPTQPLTNRSAPFDRSTTARPDSNAQSPDGTEAASTNGDHPHHQNAAPDEDDEGIYVPPRTDVMVRVMGEVTVEGRQLSSPSDIELLALLVCLRDRTPNVDTLATIVGASTIRSVQNRISRLRSKLGIGSDGNDLIPLARPGRNAKGTYRVSALVMTDVELLEHRYRAALNLTTSDALDVLTDGLKLMDGPAFRARHGYSWAVPEGVHARIAAVVNAYAATLMEHAFDAGRLDLVLETARRAGQVIDDAVAELPMWRLERDYADRSGDPELTAAAREALERLRRYSDDTDSLAPNNL